MKSIEIKHDWKGCRRCTLCSKYSDGIWHQDHQRYREVKEMIDEQGTEEIDANGHFIHTNPDGTIIDLGKNEQTQWCIHCLDDKWYGHFYYCDCKEPKIDFERLRVSADAYGDGGTYHDDDYSVWSHKGSLYFDRCPHFALNKEVYKEYLAKESWKKFAKAIKAKAGYKCEVCGSPYNLHIHHTTYDSLTKETEYDVVCLCEKCHRKLHRKEKE